MPSEAGSGKSHPARILREPLLHFVALGALLWAISMYLQAPARRPTLLVSRAHVAQLAEHYRRQYGVSPTPAQLDLLVEADITEELQYRAALELGLGRNDEIVRRRLVQKYEFLQQDLVIPEEPSDAQLRAYYDQSRARYRSPARVTFTQVFFSPDHRTEAGAQTAAGELALALNQHHRSRAPDAGDHYPGPSEFVALSEVELARVFGQEGLSHDVFSQPTGRWSPPLHSGYGWHTVYVVSSVPTGQADFEAVRDRVRDDYLETQRTQRNATALRKLRTRYEVIRE